MDIQTQQVAGAAPTTTRSATESGRTNSALNSDFDTFLKMLTVQMENQDPLNPLESSEFAVQLATFSGVEQQIRTNDLLADMIAGRASGGLAELAGWVGMEARVSGPAQFDGAPIALSVDPDPGSDAAYVVVRDDLDRVIARKAAPVEGGIVLWGGAGSDGRPLLPGAYSFELESVSRGEITSAKPVEHYALVQEARIGSDGIDIVLAGGRAIASSEVTALRRP